MVMTAQDTKQKPGYKRTEVGVIPEDWKVHTLSDEIDQLEAGVSVNSVDEEFHMYGHEQAILKTSAVSNGYFLPHENKKIAPKDIKRAKLTPRVNSIIISRMNTIDLVGECGYVEKDYPNLFLPDRLWMMRVKRKSKINVKWLSYLLSYREFKSKIKEAATGTSGSMKNISKGSLLSINIPFPPSVEQHAIAAAISDVDALITSLDKLIVKKLDIKQATMQQLLTGKTRLPGFSGEWEVKTLEEIGEKFVNGGTPSTQKSEYWQGNIPWITGADVISQKISDIRRFITTEAVKNSSTNIVERGNLLLVTRTGVGKLAVASFDVAISQDITGIYVKKEQVSIEYLFHYFNYSSENLKSLNQGTSIAGITRETLLSIKVYLPSLSEQRAISSMVGEEIALPTANPEPCM